MRPEQDVFWTHLYDNGTLKPNEAFPKALQNDIISCTSVDIISGYIGHSTAKRYGENLINVARLQGRVRILIGMAYAEGLDNETQKAWSKINAELQKTQTNSGVFSFKKKIHAKLYVFHNAFSNTSWMYSGSQNFNFSSGNMELMMRLPLHPTIEEQVSDIFSDKKNLIPLAKVKSKPSSVK